MIDVKKKKYKYSAIFNLLNYHLENNNTHCWWEYSKNIAKAILNF